MSDEKKRYKHYMPDYCTLGAQSGPQTIVVRQVLGEKERQKVLDLHVRVPERKPAIEQIVDVFVKNVEVNSVDVITDKVIVRGEFEVKAIYVACLPQNPVHAVEIKHCKWTQDIDMPGARRGMDAEAGVVVEFVDYDVPEMTRAYKYKYHGCDCDTADTCDTTDTCDCTMNDACEPEFPPHHHHPKPPFQPAPPCGSMDPCPNPNPCPNPCPPPKPPKPPRPPMPPMPPVPPVPQCPPCPPPCDPCDFRLREFDVSVVLKITAKVLADREVQMNPQNATSGASQTLPPQPKG